MRTRYTFLSDGEPVMLSVSWEPAELTEGTPVMFPEEGSHAGRGVIERMEVIGQRITHAEETVTARPALASEATRLKIRPGATRNSRRMPQHGRGRLADLIGDGSDGCVAFHRSVPRVEGVQPARLYQTDAGAHSPDGQHQLLAPRLASEPAEVHSP